MKVTKAVILAAGLGTRVLPASKSVPKEMINIVDKPAMQYLVEEAAASGITDVLIITNRGKGVIEDHFDRAPELEAALSGDPGKKDLYECVKNISGLAEVFFVRQKETKGVADALMHARAFTGDEPFAVFYGDDVIMGDDPAIGQLCRAYEKYGKPVAGVQEVARESIGKYCSLKVSPLDGDRVFNVHQIIEKPREDEIMSLFAILGRYILTPDIYAMIEKTPINPRGHEVYFTDTLSAAAGEGGLICVNFEGTRYDMGNKLGIMQANVETALKHPEIGPDFAEYLKGLVKTL